MFESEGPPRACAPTGRIRRARRKRVRLWNTGAVGVKRCTSADDRTLRAPGEGQEYRRIIWILVSLRNARQYSDRPAVETGHECSGVVEQMAMTLRHIRPGCRVRNTTGEKKMWRVREYLAVKAAASARNNTIVPEMLVPAVNASQGQITKYTG